VSRFNLIALTPPGLTEPSVAIAAARAGALGVLDLEYVSGEQVARAAIAKLVHYASHACGTCGIKLDSQAEAFFDRVFADLPEQVEVVVLTPWGHDLLPRQVERLHQQGRTVLLEATCLEQALLGERIGVDGLIAKGHEAGGWVGQETAFVLLQQTLAHLSLPVWVQGGIGLHTAAACYVAGAAGVVLDMQLALTRESLLPAQAREAIARMDGSEAFCLGEELGRPCRVYTRRGLAPVEELRDTVWALVDDPRPQGEKLSAWHRAVRERVGWGPPEQYLWPLGQDVAFASRLARRFRTVGGVLQAMRRAVDKHVEVARSLCPLNEGSPLARSHGTRYPIVQGPMARISDTPAFAAQVAEQGGLPFMAMGLSRAPEIEALLDETRRLLGDRPWGVGLLGFAPPELRREQLDVIRAYCPPFALIAGGRSDQARALEREGIQTYLHVPSPELLRMFLRDGARRFVFEGREGGGHVGPRSSFVLWNEMIDVLLEELPRSEAESCHVLFAGGVHDALSASMVAAMAAPLAERGVQVGVLVGTAYLFTAEAVSSGAILPGFQREAIRCRRTVVLESGPGHAVRCIDTPFTRAYIQEKQRLLREGLSPEQVRKTLEEMEIGRLRIAAKGVKRHPRYGEDPQAPKFILLDEEAQRAEGLYMIGQVATLRGSVCTMAELHRDIAKGSSQRLAAMEEPHLSRATTQHEERPSDIAIIGMSCIMPKAPDLQSYWENILNKVDAITEVPADHWDWRLYYDPDRWARDKVYSKWGGFLDDVPFDPTQYGIPPSALPSIDPVQLLTLEAVNTALKNAGYSDRPFDREHTSVIFGASGGTGDIGQLYVVRSWLPHFLGDVPPDVLSRLPEWTEDSFPGLLLSIIAGRVANRFDLHGMNFTVDAACASSMAALYVAVKELETGSSDMVIVGGADMVQNPFSFLCFGKVQALSPRGRCRTFDDSADGTVIGEGIGVLVLKRLADAERDGDRIYAVIKAVGRSSDGRAKGLTAPEPAGQVRALQRAYSKAGFSPATVGLIEAHGTGTVAGDKAEIESLMRVFGAATDERQFCAIGSVKSMVGHQKATAAVAGLIKATLALHHKVLPPTLGVEKPSSMARILESAFYVNTEPRPWINSTREGGKHPRRAGVSAFGFGGTNFHTVLEEYTGDFLDASRGTPLHRWSSELLVWDGASREELLDALQPLEQAMAQGAKPLLRDLAYTLSQSLQVRDLGEAKGRLRLAIVASSLEDLQVKLARVREALSDPGMVEIHDPEGIYFAEQPLAREGKLAFLFPGQGSQYPGMLRDLAILFPEVCESFERADETLAGRFPQPLSRYVFPPPAFEERERKAQAEALTQTQVAQPALGAANIGAFRLLQALGIEPDMVAGHSYGEYVALCAAGVFGEEALFILSEARGRFIVEASGEDMGTMAAVFAGPEDIADVVDAIDGLWMSNLNSPRQTMISGLRPAVEEARARLKERGVRARPIPVACGFHSPLVAPAQERLAEFLSSAHQSGSIRFAPPRIAVFSNTLAAPYPRDPEAVVGILSEHLLRPVQFVRQIEAMYDAGARIFVEVGPRTVLTDLARRILSDKVCLTVPIDGKARSRDGDASLGPTSLLHALAQLAAHGVEMKLDRLYEGRSVRKLDLSALVEETRERPLPQTTWLVNGSRARPLYLREEAQDMAEAEAKGEAPAAHEGKAFAKGQAEAASQQPVTAVVSRPSQEMGEPDEPKAPPAASQPIADERAPSSGGLGGAGLPKVTTALSGNGAEQVMVRFQQLMDRFLDTQKSVMLAYLQGASQGEVVHTEPGARQVEQPPSETPELGGEDSPPLVPTPPSAPSESAQTRVKERSDAAEVLEMTSLEGPIPAVSEAQVPSDGPQPPAHAPRRVVDRELLTQQLLQIVSERTGYPLEMLDLHLDMEADLGIDSIKRVEILGSFQQAFLPPDQQLPRGAMEQLTGIRTLGGIVDWGLTLGAGEERPGRTAESRGADEAEETVGIPRAVLIPVEAPLAESAPRRVEGRLFLITDDGQGIAQTVAEELRLRGADVALVRPEAQVREVERGLYAADLEDSTAVSELVRMVRQRQGPLAGIVHLLPLRPRMGLDEMDLAAWRECLRLEVKGFFYLIKAAGEDLRQSGMEGGSWLLTATALGGTFAVGGEMPVAVFPGQGGLAGLVKTAALEWPEVRCKVVDFEPLMPASIVAGHLLQEILRGDERAEVGYRDGYRFILRPTRVPLDEGGPERLRMNSDWVVLVTGGARGIMAEVARELAERYRPTLILCGRSPLPAPEESVETAGLTSVQDLKRALIEQLRRREGSVMPAQVEAALSRLLKERDMRSSLAAMRAAGAKVHYYQVDVRDEDAVRQLIQEIYRVHGRLDGVIHGAGVIEDKLIVDKTPDSFDRVFDTKADSAFILSRTLRPDALQFLVFFASAAGRFGNRGQSDYAAGNEVMNKLAEYLNRRWPGRVLSINWGPWLRRDTGQGTGMVSPELQRQFAKRGIQLIPFSVGCRMLDQELRYGRKEDAEIVVASGGGWDIGDTDEVRAARGTSSLRLPLLQHAEYVVARDGAVEMMITLDPSRDLCLRDHQLDGHPVLPTAGAIELLAEVVAQGWPELEIVSLRDIRVLKGVVLRDGPQPVRVIARPLGRSQRGLRILAEIKGQDPGAPAHYRATVELAETLPEPPLYDRGLPPGLREFPMSVEEAYRRYLFHGPTLQCISEIQGIADQGIVAKVIPSMPRQCLVEGAEGEWLIDPVVIDSGFQLAIIWARIYHDFTPLPSCFRAYHRYGPLAAPAIHCYLHTRARPDSLIMHTDLYFVGPDGCVLGTFEGAESTCSRALNRLAAR